MEIQKQQAVIYLRKSQDRKGQKYSIEAQRSESGSHKPKELSPGEADGKPEAHFHHRGAWHFSYALPNQLVWAFGDRGTGFVEPTCEGWYEKSG